MEERRPNIAPVCSASRRLPLGGSRTAVLLSNRTAAGPPLTPPSPASPRSAASPCAGWAGVVWAKGCHKLYQGLPESIEGQDVGKDTAIAVGESRAVWVEVVLFLGLPLIASDSH